MNLRSMVISEQEKKENSQESQIEDKPQYPYGLRLDFDNSSYEKLGLSDPPEVGEKVVIHAMAEVVEIAAGANEGDVKKYTMALQVTEIEVEEKEKNHESKLYGDGY